MITKDDITKRTYSTDMGRGYELDIDALVNIINRIITQVTKPTLSADQQAHELADEIEIMTDKIKEE